MSGEYERCRCLEGLCAKKGWCWGLRQLEIDSNLSFQSSSEAQMTKIGALTLVRNCSLLGCVEVEKMTRLINSGELPFPTKASEEEPSQRSLILS